MHLTFLGRIESRWRVRVDLPPGAVVTGLRVGLVGDDGRRLGPQLVAPGGQESCFIAEVKGPCTLPHGTVIEAVADLLGGGESRALLAVDRRRGLHAFLHADGRLPVQSQAEFESLTRREQARLGQHVPWLGRCEACSTAPGGGQDDLLAMLREEFDVDPAELDDDLLAMLGREQKTG